MRVALLADRAAFAAQRARRRRQFLKAHGELDRGAFADVSALIQLHGVHLRVQEHRPLLAEFVDDGRDLLFRPHAAVPPRLLL